jgi:hypothetical protein
LGEAVSHRPRRLDGNRSGNDARVRVDLLDAAQVAKISVITPWFSVSVDDEKFVPGTLVAPNVDIMSPTPMI